MKSTVEREPLSTTQLIQTRPSQDNNKPRSLTETVSRYRALVARLTERIMQEDPPTVASYLGMSMTNYYTKRRGERPFNYADVARLVERYGNEEDRADLQTFLNVRDGLHSWLQRSPVPLVEYRRLLSLEHHRDLARRGTHPHTWKVDDLEKIGKFIEGLAYVPV